VTAKKLDRTSGNTVTRARLAVGDLDLRAARAVSAHAIGKASARLETITTVKIKEA